MQCVCTSHSKRDCSLKGYISRVLYVLAVILALQNFSFIIHAQPLQIHQYGVEEGLPTYFVKDIIQDSLGYVYIASDEGLSVFNGITFNNYTKAIQSKYVKHLYVDNSGRILVVTDGGISKISMNNGELQFSRFLKSSQQLNDSTLNFPKEIYQDKKGAYWVSEPNAISRVNGKGDIEKRYLFPERERSTSYFASFKMFELNEKLFTISEKGGIYQFDSNQEAFNDQSIEVFRNDGASIKDVYQTGNTTVLIAATNGLYAFSLSDGKTTINQIISDKHLTAITPYQNDQYIFSTINSDLFTINKSLEPSSVKLIMETPVHGINKLHSGSHRSIWVSSNQGIAMFKPRLLFQTPFPDRFQYTQAITKTRNGKILAANNYNLYKIKKEADKLSLKKITTLQNGQIRSVSHSSTSNTYWIGTHNGTLHRYRDGDLTTFDIDPKPSGISTAIDILFEDNHDHLWLVREELPGVIIRTEDGETQYAGPDKGLSSQVQDIIQTDSKDIFLGANGAEEYLFQYNSDTNTFRNISAPLPFPTGQESLLVYDISALDNDNIYLATNYGILVHANDQVSKIDLPANFPSHLIRSIEVKNDNFIWLGTENGLYTWHSGYLRPFNDVENESNIAVNFRSLVSNQENNIWAGSIFNGLLHISWDLTTNHKTPAPKVTEILAAGNSVEDKNELKILNNQQVEFRYHSMIYPAEKVYYQTRIPEISKQWTSFQRAQSVIKTNIPVGNYRLQIRALHSTHQPSAITTVPFEIVYPWYARWFTIIGVLLFISIFGLVIYSFRRETIKRRLTQVKLRKTEEKLHAIISNTPIVLFVLNKEGYFVLCEGEGLKRMGYKPSFFKDKHYRQIFLEAYYRKKIEDALNGKEVKYERTIGNKTLSSRLHPVFDDDHNVSQVIGISIDITERVTMEHKLLKAKNEAVRANEAKSTFLANMSHELRTPLNAILGYTQILQRHKNTDPKIREHLEVMYKSGRHLLNMINDILDLSKIESGQIEIHKSNVNFRTLLEEIIRMFKPRAKEKNLNLEMIYSSDMPPRLMLDEDKIRQIVINLVSNAISYTETGSVVVKVKPTEDQTNLLLLSVCDTGIGIPSEQLTNIFTPFIQSHPQAKEGTGLGLSITKKLVNKMGGQIDIDSETGQNSGTCFTITLPYADTTSVVEEKDNEGKFVTDQLPQLASSKTALLADDIPENLHMLQLIMENMGFEVVAAEDGNQAVKFFKNVQPDIVITDIIMPELSGKEAFEKMKKHSGDESPPFIALTASGLRSSKQDLLEAGFDAYFRKPFEVTELAETIVRLLGEEEFVVEKSDGDTKHSQTRNGTSKEIYQFIQNQLSEEDFRSFKESLLVMDKDAIKNILEEHKLTEYEQLTPLIACLDNNNYRFLIDLNEVAEDK